MDPLGSSCPSTRLLYTRGLRTESSSIHAVSGAWMDDTAATQRLNLSPRIGIVAGIGLIDGQVTNRVGTVETTGRSHYRLCRHIADPGGSRRIGAACVFGVIAQPGQ